MANCCVWRHLSPIIDASRVQHKTPPTRTPSGEAGHMNHFYFILLLIVILSLPASAQQIAPATSPIKTTNASAQKELKEIDPEVLQRRSMALSLLQSLAIDARHTTKTEKK